MSLEQMQLFINLFGKSQSLGVIYLAKVMVWSEGLAE